jgi:hypothetical protein
VAAAAEGNPLFLEQLAAARAEDGDTALPESIHALLAARIERLEAGERRLLRHAAVEGRSFHRGALDDGGDAQLVALARRGLIRPDEPAFAGEEAYRFAHALVREAAYAGLPKRRRAELHEHVARWIDARPGRHDELVGFHLEQACRGGAEVGGPALAGKAAERLAAAARTALLRGDLPAGVRMLERAVALPAPAREQLLPALGVALLESGRLEDAERVLATPTADPRLAARLRVERTLLRLHAGDADLAEARRVADASAAVLARHGDEAGQCRAWRLRAWVEWTSPRRRARTRRGGGRPSTPGAPARRASGRRSSAGARRPRCSVPRRSRRGSVAARRCWRRPGLDRSRTR